MSGVSRRSLLRGTVAALATGGACSSKARAISSAAGPETWRTWVLASSDEVRPAPPSAPTADEFDEVRRLQGARTVEVARMVDTWANGPAVLPWTALAVDLIAIHR